LGRRNCRDTETEEKLQSMRKEVFQEKRTLVGEKFFLNPLWRDCAV